MAGIDDLINTFIGRTETALNAPKPSWQQELLETVNPEKVRRQNIARALAQASTAMATTPGNFLTGLAAGASAGTDAFLTGQEEGRDRRSRVTQLLGMQEQRDQDRSLDMLHDAIGVKRNQSRDAQDAEDRVYGRVKDEREWGLRQKESDARIANYGRGGLTQSQVLTTKRSIRSELNTLERQLLESAKLDENLTPEVIADKIRERQAELEDYYGITLDDAGGVDTQTPAGGKTDMLVPKNGGIVAQPPPVAAAPAATTQTPPQQIREGTVARNKATGERIIYRNGQWQPL